MEENKYEKALSLYNYDMTDEQVREASLTSNILTYPT